jgi:hypothetical protein
MNELTPSYGWQNAPVDRSEVEEGGTDSGGLRLFCRCPDTWEGLVTKAKIILPMVGFAFATLGIGVIPAKPQTGDGQSCAETLTEQLRRFSQKCVSDLVTFVASKPKMAARIYSDKEKYYVSLTQADDGLLAEAVSKYNFPLMKDDTPETLKRLGWSAPENESDNWKKKIASDRVKNGAAADELSEALAAYGLKQGEAISLTIGADVSK